MKLRRITLALFALAACNGGKEEPQTPPEAIITPWNRLNASDEGAASHAGRTGGSALTLIGGSYIRTVREATDMEAPVYPRFIKTTDGRWLMFFHNGSYNTTSQSMSWAGSYCAYAESPDLVNWSYVKQIFPIQRNVQSIAYGDVINRYYAGAHPVRLSDGTLMVVASYRGSIDMRHRTKDNGLAVRFSSDEGRNWTQEMRICVGTNWEPRPLVLSSGRIVIYYTDSRPFVEGVWDDKLVSSGVSYIYSDDNGQSWKPENAHDEHLPAFRQKRDEKDGVSLYTDQMPGVIELLGKKQLVGTGESNMALGNANSTDYWVSLARSDENGDWGQASPHPSGELPAGRQDWEKKFTKGAGPQIEQFRSGETVLTYNNNNYIYFRLGDENGASFGPETRLFEGESPTGRGFWSSCLPDGHMLVAGMGGSGGKNGLGYYLQLGRFYLNHDIRAVKRNVKVDGNNSEWEESDHALFVGSAGNMHATLRCSINGDRLYFLAEMDASQGLPADYACVYFADPSAEELSEGDVYLRVSGNGELRCCRYSPGWYVADIAAEAVAASGSNCWLAECSIPLAALPVRNGELRVNFSVNDSTDGLQAIRSLSVYNTDNWMKLIAI